MTAKVYVFTVLPICTFQTVDRISHYQRSFGFKIFDPMDMAITVQGNAAVSRFHANIPPNSKIISLHGDLT